VADEACADGVVEDVVERAREVLVGGHDAGGEAVAPEVTPPPVPAVEALGVEAVEPPVAVGEVLPRRAEHEVDVVRHQAERDHVPAVGLDHLAEEAQEAAVVVVVPEDEPTVDASRGDVVDAAVGKPAAGDARHGSTVCPRPRGRHPCARTATLSARSPWPYRPRTRDSP
jgi:hypothetical protein